MCLTRNLLAARKNCFNSTQRHRRHTTIVAIDCSRDQFVQQLIEFEHLGIALGLSHLLNDDLLGRLSADPADDVFVLQRFLADATDDLPRRSLDNHFDVSFFTVILANSRDQTLLDCAKQNFLVDAFLAMQRVYDPQYFVSIHVLSVCSRNSQFTSA